MANWTSCKHTDQGMSGPAHRAGTRCGLRIGGGAKAHVALLHLQAIEAEQVLRIDECDEFRAIADPFLDLLPAGEANPTGLHVSARSQSMAALQGG